MDEKDRLTSTFLFFYTESREKLPKNTYKGMCCSMASQFFLYFWLGMPGDACFKEDAKVASKPTKVEVYIERLMLTLVKWLWRQSIYTQKKFRHKEHH